MQETYGDLRRYGGMPDRRVPLVDPNVGLTCTNAVHVEGRE
ncbi:hypothetical protein [Nostocoides vanveenii]